MVFNDYRKDDISRKLKIMSIRPLDIMVTGVTGAGKSTTLNGLFEKCVAKVGTGVDPETMDLANYELSDVARFWDTPGLGDGVEQDRIHAKKIIDLLYKTYAADGMEYGWIDLVLVIVEGINRDMGSTYKLLNEIIVPNFQRNRILVAINQSDVAMKGRHWDIQLNKPDSVLEKFLKEQANSVKRRVKEATGTDIIMPVYYSGECGYNINRLLDLIIDNMPTQRRNLIVK